MRGQEKRWEWNCNWISMIPNQNGLLEYLSEESNIDLLLVSELQEQVQKNILLPLDELLREEGKDIYDVIAPEYMELGKVDGRQYGILLNRDMASAYGVSIKKRSG